mmetsp:Transcript_41331/g.36684  ORF Transcript_41331/g.36684 Transcript_41331/m.36684 type:complete len:235 (-) Transcript_41331:50-754(-)
MRVKVSSQFVNILEIVNRDENSTDSSSQDSVQSRNIDIEEATSEFFNNTIKDLVLVFTGEFRAILNLLDISNGGLNFLLRAENASMVLLGLLIGFLVLREVVRLRLHIFIELSKALLKEHSSNIVLVVDHDSSVLLIVELVLNVEVNLVSDELLSKELTGCEGEGFISPLSVTEPGGVHTIQFQSLLEGDTVSAWGTLEDDGISVGKTLDETFFSLGGIDFRDHLDWDKGVVVR